MKIFEIDGIVSLSGKILLKQIEYSALNDFLLFFDKIRSQEKTRVSNLCGVIKWKDVYTCQI